MTCQKTCSAKDEGPPGRLIYSQDLHAIYEADGEEHQASTLLSLPLFLPPDLLLPALCPKSLPFRQTLPRQ